jgi:hypothetical protein
VEGESVGSGEEGGVTHRRRPRYLPTLYAGKYRQTLDPRGYVRVIVGKAHPHANSGGWCWRHRLVAGESIGRKLLKCEHAHHLDSCLQPDGSKLDAPENLEVCLAEYHASYHGFYTLIAGLVGRAPNGRFVELDRPLGPYAVPRFAAIIGRAAAEFR